MQKVPDSQKIQQNASTPTHSIRKPQNPAWLY